MKKPLYKSIILISLLFTVSLAFFCKADTIYLRDGRTVSNVRNIKDTGNYFLASINGKNITINKTRIDRIVSNTGNVIFEQRILTAKVIEGIKGPQKYNFYLNNKKIGLGEWDEDNSFSIEEGDLPDGVYKQYFNTGKLERTFPIKDNELTGTVDVYYNSGRLARKGNFVEGYENGESLLYYKTGELKGKSVYDDGEKSGKTILYYPSGNIKAEMIFEDGKINGLQKMYYENGKLSNIVNFRDGVKNGEFKQFYANGKLKVSGTTSNGKLDGTVTVYYESGRIKNQKRFTNGRVIKNT